MGISLRQRRHCGDEENPSRRKGGEDRGQSSTRLLHFVISRSHDALIRFESGGLCLVSPAKGFRRRRHDDHLVHQSPTVELRPILFSASTSPLPPERQAQSRPPAIFPFIYMLRIQTLIRE